MPHVHSYVFIIEAEVGAEDEPISAIGDRLEIIINHAIEDAAQANLLGTAVEVRWMDVRQAARCTDRFTDLGDVIVGRTAVPSPPGLVQ